MQSRLWRLVAEQMCWLRCYRTVDLRLPSERILT